MSEDIRLHPGSAAAGRTWPEIAQAACRRWLITAHRRKAATLGPLAPDRSLVPATHLSREEYWNLPWRLPAGTSPAKDFSEKSAWSAFSARATRFICGSTPKPTLQDYRQLADWVGQADSRGCRVVLSATEPACFAANLQGAHRPPGPWVTCRLHPGWGAGKAVLGATWPSGDASTRKCARSFSEPTDFPESITTWVKEERSESDLRFAFGNVRFR